MKFRLTLLNLLFALICITNTLAQSHDRRYEDIDKKNIIKINLLSPFLGTLSLQYEKIINDESSMQYGFYYFSGTLFAQSFPVLGFCFTPEYRFYLSESTPHGIYIQPYLRFARFWLTGKYANVSDNAFTGIAGGMVFGKQWLFKNKISMDLYAGPLYTKIFFVDNSSTRGLPNVANGYWIRTGLTLGYYF